MRLACVGPLAARVLQIVPILLVVVIVAFTLLHLLPGDPAQVIAGDQAPPEAVDRIRRELGLDQPLLQQLLLWLRNLAVGDFGRSLILDQPVLTALGERLPVTLSLTLVALVITVSLGIGCGILAAYHRDTWIDRVLTLLALLGVSLPSFWIGILSVTLFSVLLGWLPSGGYVPLSAGVGPWLRALLQPAFVLALFQIGFLARITRSAMLDVLGQDYVRTARAKGVAEWAAVVLHAFRNALIPILTASGIILSLLIGGSVVIEQVFAFPGVGRMVVQAILQRDYPLVQGTMLLLGFIFVFVNLAVDLLYTLADPRLRGQS